jgi:hypothetical protein
MVKPSKGKSDQPRKYRKKIQEHASALDVGKKSEIVLNQIRQDLPRTS